MACFFRATIRHVSLCLFFAASLLLLPVSNAHATDITYTGDGSQLQSKPLWFSYPSSSLLFPGTALMPEGSGNNITVDFTSGASPNAVIGGLSETSDSLNNIITIKKGTISGRLVGGYVDRGPGSANGNQVIVENGAINGSISGGEALDGAGSAKGNALTIKAGVTVQYGVSGGTAYQGEANNNIVTVTGAALGQSVWGGSSSTGAANENKVTITDSSVFAEIYGGSNGVGVASKNEVIVHSSIVTSNHNMGVIGGLTSQGNSVENTVTISGTSVVKDVFGGRTELGSVIGNKVFISDTVNVQGGASGGLVTQGSGDARGNELTMTGGTVAANIAGGKLVKLTSDVTHPTGNALYNTLNISGGTVTAAAYGGMSSLGYTDHNQVVISGTAKLNGGLIGGYSMVGGGYSAYNSVTIKGGEVVGALYGGRSDSSYASYNAVTMEGGKATTIFGAYAPTNNVANNVVTLTGGTVTSMIYGGFTSTGLATNNAVTIGGGTVVDIIAAYSGSNNANTNTLNISKGAATGNVYGGWSGSGATANGNKITIGSEATVGSSGSNNVYGGFNGVGAADNNIVTVNGGVVKSIIYGGSGKNQANGNIVTAKDGTLGAIIGGFSSTGDARNNHVIIDGGTVTGNVFAGYAQNGGKATNNAITITRSANLAASILVGGYRAGGTGDVFTGNTLNVNGFKGNIQGFMNFENINFFISEPLENGEVVLKTLTAGATNISNSNISVNFSGSPLVLKVGNRASLLDASAGTLVGSVNRQGFYGINTAQGKWTYSLSTANNKLDLFVEKLDIDTLNAGGAYDMAAGNGSGQWVELDVHNQFSATDFTIASSASQTASLHVDGLMKADSFTAIKNAASLNVTVGVLDVTGADTTLALTDTAAWNGSTGVLFNTIALGEEKTLTVTGNGAFDFNHLHVRGKEAVWDGALNAGGKQMAFFLSSNVGNNDTMCTVQGAGGADITASTVHVGVMGGSSPLKVGNQVILIDAAGGITGAPINANSQAQGMQGVSLLYEFALEVTPTQLLAYVTSEGINPQTKALSEGRVAGLGFVNQGAELASEQGVSGAVSALDIEGASWRPVGFGAISGGSSRYNTGSHIDVSGVSLVTGVAWGADVSGGRLALAPFFEMGRGTYDSYNSFSNAASVKGGGATNYHGGGVLARYDAKDGAFAGLYVEASVRGGWVDTNFSSNDLHDSSGRGASYDSGAAYLGGHSGLGYIWTLNEQDSLDFSSKYLWTRQDGDTVSVANDPIHFDASSSHRWRNGARFNHALDSDSGLFTPYIGASFEYEFDGEASATTYDRPIMAPSLKGGTSAGELGFVYKPVEDKGLSVNFGLQGYEGMREGVRGDLQVKYEL